MKKRSKFDSSFKRHKNDYYRTFDKRAHNALNAVLPPGTKFVECCYGAGDLARGMEALGHKMTLGCDIAHYKGQPKGVLRMSALCLETNMMEDADCIITNPPWTRAILHDLIDHLSGLKPAWLLFEADWAHTVQSAPYMRYCTDIISVGRLKWIEGSKGGSLKDCAWYRFDKSAKNKKIVFHPRVPK